MNEQFANNAATALADGSLNNTTNPATFNVTSAAAFPASGNFRVLVGTEILLVTAVTGTAFTASRGQEGTAATAHSSGAAVTQIITDQGLLNAIYEYPLEIVLNASASISIYDAAWVCEGTSANYVVTLPPATGFQGKTLRFRMAPQTTLSKLVTLTSSGSETIDGSAMRVMWAGECCTLQSDGSNWFKVAGRSAPMMCLMHKSTTQTIAGSKTAILCDTVDVDNTGLMGNGGSGYVQIVRPGTYSVLATVGYNGSSPTTRLITYAEKNGSVDLSYFDGAPDNSGIATHQTGVYCALAVGDHIQPYGFPVGVTTPTAVVPNNITVCEIPAW